MQKIQSLESLRGFAALLVVFSHFAFAFFPAMVVGQSSAVGHSGYESLILHSPLNFFINGHFAVACFFVLSGFVLSYGFFTKGKFDLVAAALRRYFRLVPIVLASVLLAYLLLRLGLFYNQPASDIAQSGWLAQFWPNTDVSFFDALWDGLVGVFALRPTGQSLNPLLWTIYYEMIGSLIVYAVLALAGKDSRRWLIYLVLMIILSDTFYLGFVVGMMLCDVFVNKTAIINWLSRTKKGYKLLLLIVAVYFASYPAYLPSAKDLGLIHVPLQFFADGDLTKNVLYVSASAIIISLLISGSKLRKVFELKPFIHLGGVSYSLYATHLLVLGSFGCGMFILFSQLVPYNLAALISFVLFITVTILVATVFRKYVDQPSITLSRRIFKK